MSVLSLTPSPSLATSILGGGKTSFLNNALLVIAGSILIALTAQVSIPLPFTPVPVTGQTFGVLVVGMARPGTSMPSRTASVPSKQDFGSSLKI